jgi:hypothetical protein
VNNRTKWTVRNKSKVDIEVKWVGGEKRKQTQGKKRVRKAGRAQERKYPTGNNTVERHWGMERP